MEEREEVPRRRNGSNGGGKEGSESTYGKASNDDISISMAKGSGRVDSHANIDSGRKNHLGFMLNQRSPNNSPEPNNRFAASAS